MGCVFGRELSSGIVSGSRESRNASFESNRKVENVVVSETDANVVEVENECTQKEEKADGERKQRGERRSSKPNPRLGNIPKNLHGEQVVAGWPSWLSDACGEALNGWIPRRADTFEKIDKVGSGTYSNVYKAKDMVTGKVVALKKVRLIILNPRV